MATEAPISQGLWPNIRSVLTYNTSWMVPLVAIERFADGHVTAGGVLSGLWVLNILVVSKWDQIAAWLMEKRQRGKHTLVSWVPLQDIDLKPRFSLLWSVCIPTLAIGIAGVGLYALLTVSAPPPTAPVLAADDTPTGTITPVPPPSDAAPLDMTADGPSRIYGTDGRDAAYRLVGSRIPVDNYINWIKDGQVENDPKQYVIVFLTTPQWASYLLLDPAKWRSKVIRIANQREKITTVCKVKRYGREDTKSGPKPRAPVYLHECELPN